MALESARKRPTSDVFLSSVGVGLSIALIYVGAIGGAFDLPGSDALPVAPEIVCLAVMSLLYAAGTYFSDRVSLMSLRRLFWAGTLLMAVSIGLSWVLVEAGAPPALSYPLAVMYGIGMVAFKLAGVGDLGYAEKDDVVFITSVTMASAGFCVVLVSFLEGPLYYGALLVVLVLEAVFFQYSGAVAPAHEPVDRATSKDRAHLDVGMAVAYGLVGVVISFVLMFLVDRDGFERAMLVLGIAMIVAVLVAAVFALAGRRSALVLAPVYQVTFVPLVALVLVFPFVEGHGVLSVLVLGIMLVVLFFRDFARTLNRLVLVSEVDVQQTYLYAWTSLPLVAGLFAGALLYEGDQAFGIGSHAASVVLTLLLCAASTIAPYGRDPQSMPMRPASEEKDLAGAHAGYWRLACEDIAEEAGLTSRELDVALLLSRGRTADVIARNLGISVHTVKTHISSVYRKTMAGSQQDFISVVEQRFDRLKRDAIEPKERL